MAGNLEGMAELTRRLTELGEQTSAKILKSASRTALMPVEKKMKMAVPVGVGAHRTYKGNLVTPGFLRRSIKRKAFIKNGTAVALIGVRREAFYGVFVDTGFTLKIRTGKKGKRTRKQMRNTQYRTMQIAARPWFKQNFIDSEQEIIDRMRVQLTKGINSAVRR